MLTLGQKRTYKFVQNFINTNHFAPTAAEIAAGTGITSRGVVHRYLKALEEAGYLRLLPNRHRNIELCSTHPAAGLWLKGEIAAGAPIEAVEMPESVDLDCFQSEDCFALRVRGDSMIEEGILDGDIVVCRSVPTGVDGQIVVALIDERDVTLKRLERQGNTVILYPANSQLPPVTYAAERVTVQGLYVGLLRYR